VISRRAFLGTVAGGLLAAPLAAEAQQAVRVHRIGFLSDSRQPWDEGFHQGLRALGYRTGQNITIEYRYSEGKLERLPSLADELVRLNVEVIVAGGTQATHAAKQSTSVIAIVMAVSADPGSAAEQTPVDHQTQCKSVVDKGASVCRFTYADSQQPDGP